VTTPGKEIVLITSTSTADIIEVSVNGA